MCANMCNELRMDMFIGVCADMCMDMFEGVCMGMRKAYIEAHWFDHWPTCLPDSSISPQFSSIRRRLPPVYLILLHCAEIPWNLGWIAKLLPCVRACVRVCVCVCVRACHKCCCIIVWCYYYHNVVPVQCHCNL